MARIIALDDVPEAVNIIKKILQRKGHVVYAFTEEEDAIAHCRHNEVDIAILDIKLKKLSGVEVLEELKKVRPQIKVIMLTGYPTLETAREAVDLGANEYCIKPIEKSDLESKVDALTRQLAQ